MKATRENIERLLGEIAVVEAIPSDEWRIHDDGETVRAENVYHIIDRHGLYDVRKAFKLVWKEADDILTFSIDFARPVVDPGEEGLRSYLEGVLIDKMLDQEFFDDPPTQANR